MAGSSESGTPITVLGAMIANGIIAIAKFSVAALTGSSAMFSEGLHSVVDTGNQGLILFGIRRSNIEADERHPFGHGKELYFWSLIVSIILFGVGGGISLYEGFSHLQSPGELHDPTWNYVVLGIAFVVESVAWWIAIRHLLKAKKTGETFWSAFRRSKDPAIYVVLGEDTAAMLGIIVAFLGITLAHTFQMPVFDAIASIVIGVILVVIAMFLAYESRSLIIGESADQEIVKAIRRITGNDEAVQQAGNALTMHFGPNDILVNMKLKFKEGLSTSEIIQAVNRLENAIQDEHPDVRRIFFEADSLRDTSATSVPA